jgi:hypothetical protein
MATWRVDDKEQTSLTLTLRPIGPWFIHPPNMPTIMLSDELRVSLLIDAIYGCWNEQLVRACFSAADAELVLKIPLNMN